MTIDLNCDMGEAYGIYKCGDDVGIMPLISVANVACGFHASDPSVMRQTVRLAKQHGVRVGAHPSYPDRDGFGRRRMEMEGEELTACIIYQVGALKGFLDAEGMALNHVKPHGALYGAAWRDEKVARAIAHAANTFGVPLMGMSGTGHEKVYGDLGVPIIFETYVDLDYNDAGQVVITRELAWKPRCARIRLVNSAASSTLDISSAPAMTVPAPPWPGTPSCTAPELAEAR